MLWSGVFVSTLITQKWVFAIWGLWWYNLIIWYPNQNPNHLNPESKPLHLIDSKTQLEKQILQELTDEYQSMFEGTGGHSVGLAWFQWVPFSVCRCQRCFFSLRLLIGDQLSILLMTDRTTSWHVPCIRNASSKSRLLLHPPQSL